MQSDSVPTWQSSKQSGWLRTIIVIFVALGLFSFGVAVGRGAISLHSSVSTVNPNLPAQLDYSSVNQVYQALRKNYDGKLTAAQLIDGLKHGLADAANDPYTKYFTAAEAKQFDDELNNTFSGIGAELSQDSSGNIVVVAPIKGYPAAKAGLQAKDNIVAVDGKSTQGWSVDKAVLAIRGKKGTKVALTVSRGNKQLTLHIIRDDIKLPSVTSKIDHGIGYLQISTFGDDTADLVSKAAAKFQAAHVRGVILDLRGNPGGLLSAAVSVSSQWLPDGTLILQEKRGSSVMDEYRSEGEHQLVGIPTVVLINDGSASAAEITAGALHDNKAAYLLGTKSFGKGVVQQLINFDDGSELKVTVAGWYRPDGQNINHQGITPDKTVLLSDQAAKAGNDRQQAAALQYLQKH